MWEKPEKLTGNSCSSAGNNEQTSAVGNPINLITGNKFTDETDYQPVGSSPLQFTRHYNSMTSYQTNFGVLDLSRQPLGSSWSHNYYKGLLVLPNEVSLTLQNSQSFIFKPVSGVWQPDEDVDYRLQEVLSGTTRTGWKVTTPNDTIETYNAIGDLLSITDTKGITQTLTYGCTTTSAPCVSYAAPLIKVTDNFNRSLNFTYNEDGKMATLTDPAGSITHYSYDANGNLATVTFPDDTPADLTDNPKKTYAYGELANTANISQPNALTGIIDENGVRYATYQYDTNGKAISTEHATGGIERYSLVYSSDGSSVSVTDPLGSVRTTQFTTALGVAKISGSDQPAGSGCNASSSAISYDENGNVASKTDFNGNINHYTFYLQRNLETRRTEAVGTPDQKITQTQWHTQFRLPIQIDSFDSANNPLYRTTFSYDNLGLLLSRTETDLSSGLSRTNRYTYDPATSQVKTIDGPRVDVSDITTFDYDPATGNLINITNALGHSTQITEYDAIGRPTRIIDTNQSVTTLTYHPRGWLTSRSRDGQTTTFEYDNVGQLIKLTRPNGAFTQYTYDAAHRLTDITDNLGNTLHYTLDAMGNVLKEEVKDSSGQLARVMEQEYDQLSRLLLNIGGENQTQHYQYDANGNLTTKTDARNTPFDRNAAKTSDPLTQDNTVTSTHDALNRLISSVHRQQSADASDDISSQYQYNTLDQLVKVTDAKGAETHYTYNALGDLLQLNSPDTGITTYTYDEAGNRNSMIDARGITVNYQYDALNRLTMVDYADNSQDVAHTYDTCTYGIGRLCKTQDQSGIINYNYDIFGNLITESRQYQGTTYTTAYSYDIENRIIGIHYPSGHQIEYSRNTLGQITNLIKDPSGSAASLSSLILYRADGQIAEQTLGNGLYQLYFYDLQGRLTSLFLESGAQPPLLEKYYTYDANDNLIDDWRINLEREYDYDGLNRLNYEDRFFNDLLASIRYHDLDANGNLYYQGTNDITNQSYSDFEIDYAANSNQMTAFNGSPVLKDATGNTTNDGRGRTFEYNPAGRLWKAYQNGTLKATYGYNSQGQRVQKIEHLQAGDQTTLYFYDLAGHLISEYQNNQPIRDYIWLNDRPLAQLDLAQNNGQVITEKTTYFTTDYLTTPRIGTDEQQNIVWRWESDAYGQEEPEVFLDYQGQVRNIRLRFPGQYFDQETQLHYNHYRYYDPTTGRYITSDPIGLAGGLNTYIYANANPLIFIDPDGLIGLFGNSVLLNEFKRGSHRLGREDSVALSQFSNRVGGAGIIAASAAPAVVGAVEIGSAAICGVASSVVKNKEAVRKAACAAGFVAACTQGKLNELDKIKDDLEALERIRRTIQAGQKTKHVPRN